jgi:hypothetical protein
MTLDLQQAKKRLVMMAVVVGLCLAVAAAGAVGAFVQGIEPLKWVFAAGMAGAFAAQIWFIAGFRRAGGGN